jgi:hypothetical protein
MEENGNGNSCECFDIRYAIFVACGVAGCYVIFDSYADASMGLAKEKCETNI